MARHGTEKALMRGVRSMEEQLYRLHAEENSGHGSASKLQAVPTFSMRLHGGELKATAHCSTRSDCAGQVRIMRCVGKRLRRLQAAAASGPGSSDVLSNVQKYSLL